jgi:hypothetical protein
MNPTASTRNAGFELLARINRWLIAGAVVIAGFLSLLAERSFRGHTGSSAVSSAAQRPSGSGSGLTPSQSAPAAASSTAPVVSGGS